MPGKIKVKVLAGRNLPVMDRASDTTDAFVEIKFGGVTHKTDVCRKSLNPHWSSTEWYRFEVDESELQDEPLQLRLMDHDTYSANDAIGKVVISLAPLLAREANNLTGIAAPPTGAVMSGWIPVFDTMHGIRGELNVIVKVELFSDFNKYKTSSCGVQFFHCPMIPPGYKATTIHGFVEELVVNDDPEYQWIDKIRTPRASNEARQVAFIKLSNQVQRLVGLKAAELGANAVVGYQQDFDLEGEAGVVARAIGTAVSITAVPSQSQLISIPPCTQQQLKKYLDILATDTETITDLNQYFQNHQDELQKLLNVLNPKTPALLDEPENVDEDEKSMDLTGPSSSKSYAGSVSIYQDDYASQKSLKHISEDQTDLNKLLKRTEDSDSDSTGPLQKIKKIKSRFFKKRFGSLRSRKSDKQDDQISLQSNSSDTSRISLTEIKNEFKKLKRLKKPSFGKGFANKEDEGIGMASILARSVIHAHTSLACIAETQDTEHSPSSTLRRTSESEPTINMSDEDKKINANTEINVDTKSSRTEYINNNPEPFASLKNINTQKSDVQDYRKLSESCPATPMTCRSENFLKLPAELGYFGSLSLSGDSSEIYSSSDEEDESSDQKTDTEKSIETTSSVVQSVLNNGVNPAIVAQMDRKLSILEGITPDLNEIHNQDLENVESKQEQSPSTQNFTKVHNIESNRNENIGVTKEKSLLEIDTSTDKKKETFIAPKQNSKHHFKFHIPFTHKKVSKSFSAPSSPVDKTGFVYRSSKRIKCQISRLSRSNMMKSISHYSLIPKKKYKEAKAVLSQPSSASDVSSKAPSHETVLGSPLLSYADLLSLDKEAADSCTPLHKSDELKVTMYIGSEPVSRTSLSGPSSLYNKEEGHVHDHMTHKKDKPALKPTGLVHTAMETILIDKVQSLLVPASPVPNLSKEKQFFDHVSEKLERVEESRNCFEQFKQDEYVKTEMMQITPRENKNSLVHTAIETILMDKVQSLLISTTPEAIPVKGKHLISEFNENLADVDISKHLHQELKSEDGYKIGHLEETLKSPSKQENIVETAMKTILLDKVHSLMPACSKPIEAEDKLVINNLKVVETEKKVSSDGLLYTAMQTMLLDKVQPLLPSSSENPIYSDEALFDKLNEELSSVEAQDNDQNTVNNSHLDISDSSLEKDRKEKKLVRQDSVHSITEVNDESLTMSKETDANIVIPCKVTQSKPVLQYCHPILSGAYLETISSLPESSLDHTDSLDVEGIDKPCDCLPECKCQECDSETNSASVCDNSHAACHFDRNEREIERSEKDKGSPRHARHESYGGRDPAPTLQPVQNPSLNSTSTPVGIHRRSSDSDLSVTPKGGSLTTSAGNTGSGGGAILRPSMNSNNLDMLEYPFLTMTEYPSGFIVHIGGTVCARSVKLVDAGGESAARAAWWAELRTELRAHARALRCNAVIAYTEGAAICEDVCVLSASGTAAVINLDTEFSNDADGALTVKLEPKSPTTETETESCSIAHVPYTPGAGPYRAELSTCGGCRRARVPAVLLATCAKPHRLSCYSKAVTLTAVAARVRRAPPAAEPGARDISDQLPFLEYELHKLLLAKLRMQGANALFSLQTQIAVGERCVMALASGTAVKLFTLPPPTPPRIKTSENDKNALDIQKALWEAFSANKAANGFDIVNPDYVTNGTLPDIEGEELPPVLDLCSDKDTCVLELDEAEDVETAKSLAVRRMHMMVYTNGLKAAPGTPPQAFAQVWRARLGLSGQGTGASTAAERHVSRALDGVTYKLRRLQPCALVAPRFQIELPEDEIQLVVSGAAIPLLDPNKSEREDITDSDRSPSNGYSHDSDTNQSTSNSSHFGNGSGDADDDIFTLDEDQFVKSSQPAEVVEEKNIVVNGQAPSAVCLTSLSFVSGSRAARRVCALRLLFVRETTAVRELGGLSGFLHTFTCEVLAIARAYTAALGGNALTSFYLTQLMLQDNAHKNQGQCLLSVGGDVVHITY